MRIWSKVVNYSLIKYLTPSALKEFLLDLLTSHNTVLNQGLYKNPLRIDTVEDSAVRHGFAKKALSALLF
jgi:hypothetical protein